MGEWDRAPAGPRRQALAVVLGVVAVAVGLAMVNGSLRPGGDHEAPSDRAATPDRLIVDRDARPPDSVDSIGSEPRALEAASDGAEPSPYGAWRPLPTAPLPPGPVVASVWTGAEFIVWQGERVWRSPVEGDVFAVYDPVDDSWRTVADASLRAGPATGAVWTGSELVALGALDTTAEDAWYDSAAAYLPGTDTWREIPSAPEGEWAWDAAVWNGEHVVVLGSVFSDGGDPQPAAVAYDPERDTWRELPAPPVRRQGGRLQAVALGAQVVVVGEASPDGDDGTERVLTVYQPATEGWTEPEPIPYQGLWSVGLAADPGAEEVTLVGAVQEGVWRDLTGVWSPGKGVAWDALPPRRTWGQHHPALVPTDEGLVSWGAGSERGWLLDEDRDAWRPLPPSPLGPRRDAAIAWTGSELLVWGGSSGQTVHDDGAAWRPDP